MEERINFAVVQSRLIDLSYTLFYLGVLPHDPLYRGGGLSFGYRLLGRPGKTDTQVTAEMIRVLHDIDKVCM